MVLQMSIKCPASGGHKHDLEGAVQWSIHLKRSSFFYLSALMVRTHEAALSGDWGTLALQK